MPEWLDSTMRRACGSPTRVNTCSLLARVSIGKMIRLCVSSSPDTMFMLARNTFHLQHAQHHTDTDTIYRVIICQVVDSDDELVRHGIRQLIDLNPLWTWKVYEHDDIDAVIRAEPSRSDPLLSDKDVQILLKVFRALIRGRVSDSFVFSSLTPFT